MATVSIILPTFNGSRSIARSIESVIAQTYMDWELIIISDGSTDQTKAVVDRYSWRDTRIIFIENEINIGVQKTLNKGLTHAQGKYIARIDDDDRWIDSNKLTKQVEYLDTHTHCVLLGTRGIICNEDGHRLGAYTLPCDDDAIRSRMLFKNPFLHPSVMMRKSAVDQVGGYDENEDTKHIEDYALWLKLGKIGTLVNLSDMAVELTVHGNSLTFQNRIVQVRRLRALVERYHEVYPHFHMAQFVLWLRMVGFTVIHYLPIPQKFLYWIQRMYKRL